jgi:predicted translin family RNA/ssDNA-binding protein
MLCRVQQLAKGLNMTSDEFIGEMRKRGCSEPTALKIWQGLYEEFKDFHDNDVYLSNLRKAADVLKVTTGTLLPR